MLARCVRGKVDSLGEKAARHRLFFRIPTSERYFIKENKCENSPPQADFFKDFGC